MMLSLSSFPVAAQSPKQPTATANYECVANTHCTVSCLVDGDKVVQTGSLKSVAVSLLAPNNYLVELVEENGQMQYAYLAGAKVVCALDSMTKKADSSRLQKKPGRCKSPANSLRKPLPLHRVRHVC